MLSAEPTATDTASAVPPCDESERQTLGRIVECADLSVDACVLEDATHELIFLSVWGRDTAIQELLARLTLDASATESLKSGFTLRIGEQSRQVFLRDTDSLEKRQSRVFRGTLFGSLIHLWLLHPQCLTPDRSQHSAYVLLQGDTQDEAAQALCKGSDSSGLPPLSAAMRQRLCSALLSLTPFPILPAWADVALETVQRFQMLRVQETLLGNLACFALHLDADRLEAVIGQMIRSHQLTAA